MNQIMKPSEIEKKSFAMITQELGARTFPEGQSEVIKRVIHTTADFDYAENFVFLPMQFVRQRLRFPKGQPLSPIPPWRFRASIKPFWQSLEEPCAALWQTQR